MFRGIIDDMKTQSIYIDVNLYLFCRSCPTAPKSLQQELSLFINTHK